MTCATPPSVPSQITPRIDSPMFTRNAGVMQIARKIDFDTPTNTLYVRSSYVASQLICLAIYYYVSIKASYSLVPILPSQYYLVSKGQTPAPAVRSE